MSRYVGLIIQGKYGEFEVTEDGGWDKMTVRFNNGYSTTCSRQMIQLGNVKTPFFPIVAGVGFLGMGVYQPSANGQTSLEYNTWIGLLHRCYSSKRQIKDVTYQDKVVNSVWHCFQNFAEWCQTATGFGNKGWEIDKDLILIGNKEYGPETCAFVPKEINLITKSCGKDNLTTGFIGVHWNDEESKFRAQMSRNGKQVILGRFNSKEAAFDCYKTNKESHVKDRANFYKPLLDERIYKALMNWEVINII